MFPLYNQECDYMQAFAAATCPEYAPSATANDLSQLLFAMLAPIIQPRR